MHVNRRSKLSGPAQTYKVRFTLKVATLPIYVNGNIDTVAFHPSLRLCKNMPTMLSSKMPHLCAPGLHACVTSMRFYPLETLAGITSAPACLPFLCTYNMGSPPKLDRKPGPVCIANRNVGWHQARHPVPACLPLNTRSPCWLPTWPACPPHVHVCVATRNIGLHQACHLSIRLDGPAPAEHGLQQPVNDVGCTACIVCTAAVGGSGGG
jgi:hypothetical protein